MSRSVILFFVVGILLLIDIYLFRNFLFYFHSSQRWARYLFAVLWWLIPVVMVGVILGFSSLSRPYQLLAMNAIGIIFFTKILAFLIMVIGEGWFGAFSLIEKKETFTAGHLSRRLFIARMGTVAAALPFISMTYGLLRTASDFRIHRVKLGFKNLPKAFDGLKIVQISDIHTGSWLRHSAMDYAVKLIMQQNPDIIVFTGDIVNNRTDEAYPFVNKLSKLSAPLGVYSILGNHDYGDYEPWPDIQAKRKNLEDMFQLHKDLNWDLLLNEHRVFERDGEKIALIGIENWGAALRFPKYGKLGFAHTGTESLPFKVLLSHDPSHWDAEIIPKYGDIDLTLSGHTHGFQFGIEIPGFKWSPSKYVYKQWAGLYQRGTQFLYVNRGTGCLGYSGRIGIKPEITVIELRSETA